ncbi:hypothetical protein QR680_011349 [Steinernema hermaphroditum]|uniref:C-type lectin domain-containing protein n=1 Tax=Steinernema hermaphroditum TaxID=289476 RepID=A0AA39MC58_9BILA|nr:hypothetical protein QR680_011349 [Steinernema hermaphroditum]
MRLLLFYVLILLCSLSIDAEQCSECEVLKRNLLRNIHDCIHGLPLNASGFDSNATCPEVPVVAPKSCGEELRHLLATLENCLAFSCDGSRSPIDPSPPKPVRLCEEGWIQRRFENRVDCYLAISWLESWPFGKHEHDQDNIVLACADVYRESLPTSIHSRAEEEFLYRYFVENLPRAKDTRLFIGLVPKPFTNGDRGDNWVWVDGTPMDYKNWHVGPFDDGGCFGLRPCFAASLGWSRMEAGTRQPSWTKQSRPIREVANGNIFLVCKYRAA